MSTPEEVEKSATDFRLEVEDLINKHNFDTYTNTPDHILAEFLTDCLLAFGNIMKKRDNWHL